MNSVRPARLDDVPELVRLREQLFADLAAGGWGNPADSGAWKERFAEVLSAHLRDETMRIVVIDREGRLVSCGMGTIDHRLPSPSNISGTVGHVFGIVTDPEYRKRGHAREITMSLLDWFDEQGLSRVELVASPDGQSLYRSLGFGDQADPTLVRKR